MWFVAFSMDGLVNILLHFYGGGFFLQYCYIFFNLNPSNAFL